MRTIIIGDIHGCNGALRALLEKAGADAGRDRLVLLGDLFDRGPESRDVFQTVQQLAADFGERFILLRGNHEDYLLQEKLTWMQRIMWERVGRAATVRSFRSAGEKMEDTIPWLREHVRYFWKEERFQCVHAGIRVDPPEVNDLTTLVHDHHSVTENLFSGKLTITGHIALDKATWFAGDGETTEEPEDGKVYRLPATGVLCIDTGCGKGGRLTALCTEGETYTLISKTQDGLD